MDNLLKETIKFMKRFDKKPKDVEWCGSEDWGWFTWEEFKELSNHEYDNGFGGQEVAEDLLIVGADWWLERHEYDGSEWWEFKELPVKPKEHIKPRMIIGGLWDTLEGMNK